MKRKLLILALLSALLMLLLCACDGTAADEITTDYIYFKNNTGAKVAGIYVTPAGEEEWGEKLNWGDYVSAGGQIHIDREKFTAPDGLYDIGAVDENGLNYDVYEVVLAPGDIFALSADGDEAVCTVTHMDGSESLYHGFAYTEDE